MTTHDDEIVLEAINYLKTVERKLEFSSGVTAEIFLVKDAIQRLRDMRKLSMTESQRIAVVNQVVAVIELLNEFEVASSN